MWISDTVYHNTSFKCIRYAIQINYIFTCQISMSKIDMELKKAFGELQQKAVETTNSLRIADVQIDTLNNSKQVACLTERELDKLDSTTNMYESVGRAFILTPLLEIKINLQKKQEFAQEKITNIENNKLYLERNLKDAENNLREMVHQRRV